MTQAPLPDIHNAKPFVKWVGGKRSLLPELLSRAPIEFNNYYEPFVGGGALFFALKNEGRINSVGGGQAFLSDINFDLINTYQVIQRDPEPLIARLKEHAAKHSKEYYYHIRNRHDLDDRIEIAARFIYLNKTCYNGLWRVNSKGEFNVPMGSYKNPAICQEEVLRACHRALQSVDIRMRDFRKLDAGAGDFVYFDPPYQPLDKTSFTRYVKDGFGAKEQTALRDLCLTLHDKGVKFMLSNSDISSTLYDRNPVFKIEIVRAPRFVNSKADARGNINELLISNF